MAKQWHRMTDEEKMDAIVDAGPDELVGFYCMNHDRYSVLILGSKKYPGGLKRGATLEFTAVTPDGLLTVCNDAGFDLQLTPEEVHEKCQPIVPVRSRRRKKSA